MRLIRILAVAVACFTVVAMFGGFTVKAVPGEPNKTTLVLDDPTPMISLHKDEDGKYSIVKGSNGEPMEREFLSECPECGGDVYVYTSEIFDGLDIIDGAACCENGDFDADVCGSKMTRITRTAYELYGIADGKAELEETVEYDPETEMVFSRLDSNGEPVLEKTDKTKMNFFAKDETGKYTYFEGALDSAAAVEGEHFATCPLCGGEVKVYELGSFASQSVLCENGDLEGGLYDNVIFDYKIGSKIGSVDKYRVSDGEIEFVESVDFDPKTEEAAYAVVDGEYVCKPVNK